MAILVNTGYTDTPISGAPVLNLLRGSVNFGADFRLKSQSPTEVVINNLTSPVDRQEKFRFSYSDIANIYSGTDIDPSVYAPSKRGYSVLAQLTETFSITDDTVPSYRVDLPISAHIVLKLPANENLTSAMIQTIIARLASGLYETGLTTTSRIASLSRGSLIPADL